MKIGCKDKNKYWFVQIIMLFLGAISYIFIEAETSYFYYARKLAKNSVSFHKNKVPNRINPIGTIFNSIN